MATDMGTSPSPLANFDTGHAASIHDAKLDFSGTKFATSSSDASVRIFELEPGQPGTCPPPGRFVQELKGHEGPVWQVAWAPPHYGTLLASCSYDGSVIIWKELDGNWGIQYKYADHASSVNSINWAPADWGLVLACGSSDGTISVLKFDQDRWEAAKIMTAHVLGCNAISWSAVSPSPVFDGGAVQQQDTTMRFVSGGCDNLVRIWKNSGDGSGWLNDVTLEGHTDWVQDVAWSPAGLGDTVAIASASRDRRVIVWTTSDVNGKNWTMDPVNMFENAVWAVSWNLVGDILVISSGEYSINLWKKNQFKNGDWERVDMGLNAGEKSGNDGDLEEVVS